MLCSELGSVIEYPGYTLARDGTTVNIDKVFLYVDNRVTHESLFSQEISLETANSTLCSLEFVCSFKSMYFKAGSFLLK